MDWIEWPAQQMTEEAKVWIDHHRRSMIESRWIFDQLSWHNQLQYLITNRSWQIIFWARLLPPASFLRHSFVFSFIRFKSGEKRLRSILKLYQNSILTKSYFKTIFQFSHQISKHSWQLHPKKYEIFEFSCQKSRFCSNWLFFVLI